MKSILLLLMFLGLSFGGESTFLVDQRKASLTRGIDLMIRDIVVYQKKLANVEKLLQLASTDTDKRNARTRIKEINLVLVSLKHRMGLAEKELKGK